MLVIFIVAFIVTLTAAVYMQFGSRAEEHVLRHKLDPDAFLLGAVCMGALSIFALANSGFSNGVGLAILFFSWIPCALIAVSIEKHQQNLCKLWKDYDGWDHDEHRPFPTKEQWESAFTDNGWDHDDHRPLPTKEQWESAITVSKNK